MVYKIAFFACLPAYPPNKIFFFSFRIMVGAGSGSDFFSDEPDPREKNVGSSSLLLD